MTIYLLKILVPVITFHQGMSYLPLELRVPKLT